MPLKCVHGRFIMTSFFAGTETEIQKCFYSREKIYFLGRQCLLSLRPQQSMTFKQAFMCHCLFTWHMQRFQLVLHLVKEETIHTTQIRLGEGHFRL